MESDLQENYGIFFDKQDDGSWKATWTTPERIETYVNTDIDALVDAIMIDQANEMKAVLWAAELQGDPNITIN